MKIAQVITEDRGDDEDRFPVGKEVELDFNTHDLGVWGANSDYYGCGVRGIIKEHKDDLLKVELKAMGIYGAYDSPDAPIRGKPIYVHVDLKKAHARHRDDLVILEFR